MADDFGDIARLEADLRNVPAAANKNIVKSMKVTSHSLKEDWQQGAEASGGYPKSYPASISYDIKFPGGAIESEIGPVLGKTAGSSAGFLDEPLSSAGVDGPIHHAGRNATESNEGDFVRGLEIAIFEALAEEVEQ